MPKRYELQVPGRLTIEVYGADGARLLVQGKLDQVPEAAGGVATRIRVTEATARPMRDDE